MNDPRQNARIVNLSAESTVSLPNEDALWALILGIIDLDEYEQEVEKNEILTLTNNGVMEKE
jgi:hypothetical protein